MALLSRRTFLLTGATLGTLVGGSLVVGTGYLATVDTSGLKGVIGPDGKVQLNAWIQIDPDNTITFAIPRTEMGQGVHTALPMLIAEELEVDLRSHKVKVVHPVAELPVYTNFVLSLDSRPEDATGPLYWFGKKIVALFPFIGTGGSTSVVGGWTPLRVAGAAARQMLIRAAAETWNVPPGQCYAQNGHVIHRNSNRRVPFGSVAAKAAKIPPQYKPRLKPKNEFKLIGQSVPRLDLPEKVTGKADFGIDARPKDTLYAAIRQSPVFGGTVAQVDDGPAKALKGVVKVVNLGDAVAVIADRYWTAKKAVDALKVTFTPPPGKPLSSASIQAGMRAALKAKDAKAFTEEGDVDTVLAKSGTKVEATYETPYLAHACMEPMNCTVVQRGEAVEIWASSQTPLILRMSADKMIEDTDTVTSHVMHNGGGFGRRAEGDFSRQAAALAAAVPGKPVKLVWSREEDIQHDAYRPAAVSRFQAVLGPDGLPQGWFNRVVTQSVQKSFADRNLPMGSDGDSDKLSVEGARELDYTVPNVRVELVDYDTLVPIGYWRSVGHSNNGFFVESFVDELARAAKADPFDYRLKMLSNNPRQRAMLERLRRLSGWGRKSEPGKGRGLAIHRSFRSVVAQVADVTVSKDGEVSVDKVYCVVDCGTVVNPDTVRAQMEGSIIFGLTAALYGEIEIKAGRVVQTNFNDYEMLTMANSPEIDVAIMTNDHPPGGVGEPGLPPIAPAVTNAIFDATGKRIRTLPIKKAKIAVSDWAPDKRETVKG